MAFLKQQRPSSVILLCCLMLFFSNTHAEVYKWYDAKGKVHLSDKRGAAENAMRIDSEAPRSSKDGNNFKFTPEADTYLQEDQRTPKGESTALTAGFWKSSSGVREHTILLRFDISDLIAEINTHPEKKIVSASLNLYADVLDKVHLPIDNIDTPKGHYNKKSDNAFYVKAVRNDWDEQSAIWPQYYSDSDYTPTSIRGLPFAKAAGSAGDDGLNYLIDLTEMIGQALKVNMRQITLELRLQRRATMSVVTFYSKEAEEENRPTLNVELSGK